MKRILLRISALGTVIALGLIAIAQAQRSGEPRQASETVTPAVAPQQDFAARAGNPLRSAMGQQADGVAGNRSQAGRSGIPVQRQPTPAAAADTISLVDATNTGFAPPIETQAMDFGESVVPTQPDLDMAGSPASAPLLPAAQAQSGQPAAMSSETIPFPDDAAAAQGMSQGALTQADEAFHTRDRSMSAMGSDLGPELADNSEPMGLPQDDAVPIRPASPAGQNAFAQEQFPAHGQSAQATFSDSPVQTNAFAAPQLAVGSGRPGTKELDGVQAPQLVIEKIAPAEIQVGRPAIFEIHVRNVGTVSASNVVIRDEVPLGTRLQSTSPQASQGTQGGLVWKLGTLKPSEDVTVEMELMPTEPGENIGSVATVSFQAEASVRTRATQPLLAIETEAPDEILKGEELALKIIVSNPGTGVAENVVLEEHVPPGFRHPAGAELEYEVGNLAPGESRELTLKLEAVHPGPLENVIMARGEPALRTESRMEIEVVAPQLEVAVQGPKQRYLEREAVYNLLVRNPGTAPARQVELAVEVPAGMKFVSGSNRAYYEEATRTVHWMLEEIPVQAGPPAVQVTLMPVEAGQHKIRLVSSDDSGAKAEVEQAVYVEGLVAMYFEVADLQDPIETGSETTYEIRVVNQGSKEATNVLLAAALPPGMQAIAAEGPTQHAQQGGGIEFRPLPRLAPKADVTYRIRVRGVQAGDQRIKVQVMSDEIRTPITKEESTRVYSDQ